MWHQSIFSKLANCIRVLEHGSILRMVDLPQQQQVGQNNPAIGEGCVVQRWNGDQSPSRRAWPGASALAQQICGMYRLRSPLR